MNNDDIVGLEEGLYSTRSLQKLYLSGNKIAEKGAKILLHCLDCNHNIESIIANSNPMGDLASISFYSKTQIMPQR
jgi:hypothetical protein